MKNIQLLILLLVGTLSFGQNKEITLDYTVTYEVPSAKRNTIDTVSVSYNKEGTYLYTEGKFLVDKFAATMFRNKNVDTSQSTTCIIYDTNNSVIYMHFDIQGNIVFLNMKLDAIIPLEADDSFSENAKVISERLEKDTFLMNKSYSTYELYPDTEPNSKINIVVDENYVVNNNNILSKLIELMLVKTKSKGSIDIDLPEGLILSISESNTSIIKAIDVSTQPIKINISHSFNIEK